MLEALVSGPVGLCHFSKCVPQTLPHLPYFSHWWFLFLSSRALHNSWMIPLVQKTLIKKKIQIYGKETWKTSNRHIFIASLWIREKEQGPEGSALDLLQLESFSHSLPFASSHLSHILIFQSRSSSIVPCLFTFSIPLSHSFWLPRSLTPSYPLADHLSVGACTDGLFPRAAGLNQLQLKMKAGGGGSEARRGYRLSCVHCSECAAFTQASWHPPLSLPFWPDIPHITHKRRRNRYAQEKASWSPAGKTRDPPSPPQSGSWFPLDVPSPINILSHLSLIIFPFSFSHSLPASGFPPGRRLKLRRESMPNFALTILSCPQPPSRAEPRNNGFLFVQFAAPHTKVWTAGEQKSWALNSEFKGHPMSVLSSIAGWALLSPLVLCFALNGVGWGS